MAPQRQLATPAYLVGFALLCIPPFDALMQVVPFRLGNARWRFGAFGLLSNAMMIPLTGLLVVFLVALVFEHRRVQKVFGWLSLLVALATAGCLVIFALDALQVRGEVNPAAGLAFKVATTTATLKAGLGILTLAAFGWAGLKTPKASRSTGSSSSRPGGLIMGTPGASRSSRPAREETPGPSATPPVAEETH